MKAVAAVFFAALALQAFAAPAALAQTATMRCKNDLAKSGDGKAAVLQKCGEPLLKDSFCKPAEQLVQPAAPQASLSVNVLPCERVDEWTYNPGRGQFMTILRFESGALTSIKYGDRVQ